MIFLACDPGQTGALGAFDKEKDKLIDYIYDFDERKYKDFMIKYKGSKLFLEFIPSVMSGAYASFILGKNIGAIKGLSFDLCEVIEKGCMPTQWKTPWKEDIDNLKKEFKIVKDKKKKLDNKDIDIIISKKYYPEVNLLVPELDENGQPKIISKGNNKGQIKYKEHDGLADMNLIGHSTIIRNLI